MQNSNLKQPPHLKFKTGTHRQTQQNQPTHHLQQPPIMWQVRQLRNSGQTQAAHAHRHARQHAANIRKYEAIKKKDSNGKKLENDPGINSNPASEEDQDKKKSFPHSRTLARPATRECQVTAVCISKRDKNTHPVWNTRSQEGWKLKVFI